MVFKLRTLLNNKNQPCKEAGERLTPRRSCRKSPPGALGTIGSSELKSSKSTSGAAGDLETPFGSFGNAPCEVDTAAGTEPALLPI